MMTAAISDVNRLMTMSFRDRSPWLPTPRYPRLHGLPLEPHVPPEPDARIAPLLDDSLTHDTGTARSSGTSSAVRSLLDSPLTTPLPPAAPAAAQPSAAPSPRTPPGATAGSGHRGSGPRHIRPAADPRAPPHTPNTHAPRPAEPSPVAPPPSRAPPAPLHGRGGRIARRHRTARRVASGAQPAHARAIALNASVTARLVRQKIQRTLLIQSGTDSPTRLSWKVTSCRQCARSVSISRDRRSSSP
jgi:hypothetical protein